MKTEIYNKLKELAFKRSHPFCVTCYKRAPSGRCLSCGTDDLARELPGVGMDWNCDWIIEHILKTEFTAIDEDAVFEVCVQETYPSETAVTWASFDTVTLLKEMDPVSWRIARDEYITSLEEDEQIVSFDNGSSYYWARDFVA